MRKDIRALCWRGHPGAQPDARYSMASAVMSSLRDTKVGQVEARAAGEGEGDVENEGVAETVG